MNKRISPILTLLALVINAFAIGSTEFISVGSVSYTHLRAHETDSYLVCRLLLEKKKRSSLLYTSTSPRDELLPRMPSSKS